MKCCIIIFPVIFLFMLPSFAQQRQITCSSQRNFDNTISIYSESNEFGEYTIKLIFSSFMGYTAMPGLTGNIATAVIDRGKKEVLKLSQDKIASTYMFQYAYTYYPGRALKRSPDSSYAYLVPATTGNSVRIFPVTSILETLGKPGTELFHATGFIYKLGDTICATRGGIVYECSDEVKIGETRTEFYKSTRNRISIQHKDGTLDGYSFVAPIKLLVREGDYIIPGQKIAVFNKESDRYYLLFSNYYLDENKIKYNKEAGPNAPSCYVYLPAHFYVPGSTKPVLLEVNKVYTAEHPKELVLAEMSKKDKKRFSSTY